MTDAAAFDVVVVGAGPAGLSAALSLARARRRTLVLDSNRPRNAATFSSHGFLTRDGVSPLELRRLGREELGTYPEVQFRKAVVRSVEATAAGFVIRDAAGETTARTVLIASGLMETFPPLPSIRSFYGTSIHSCIACDGYEYADQPLALLGESDDLAERALLLAQWSADLIVFTNGRGEISDAEESELAERGIRVDRRPVHDVQGDQHGFTGLMLVDGEVVPRSVLFVRPIWTPSLDWADPLRLMMDAAGLVVTDLDGRTSVPGVYAAGDSTPPGPQQLIVAAGSGARVADTLNRDLALARRPFEGRTALG